MAQINTFQDLLDLLDSDPEYLEALRVRLLTPELIELPAKFAELVTTVAHISKAAIPNAGLAKISSISPRMSWV